MVRRIYGSPIFPVLYIVVASNGESEFGAGERSSREVDLLLMQPATKDAVSEY